MSIARRRADLARMKAKARRIFPHDPKARHANHLRDCSCVICGNPRKYFGERTLQEQRADDVQASQMPVGSQDDRF